VSMGRFRRTPPSSSAHRVGSIRALHSNIARIKMRLCGEGGEPGGSAPGPSAVNEGEKWDLERPSLLAPKNIAQIKLPSWRRSPSLTDASRRAPSLSAANIARFEWCRVFRRHLHESCWLRWRDARDN
jgi:hypothetical protein